MTEGEIRDLALFFRLTLLDGNQATKEAIEAVHLIREWRRKDPHFPSQRAVLQATAQIWSRRGHKLKKSGGTLVAQDPDWSWKENVDLGAWREYQKNADPEELVILVWCRLLKIPESLVATTLTLSEGTIRYRLSQALRKLGSMTPNMARVN